MRATHEREIKTLVFVISKKADKTKTSQGMRWSNRGGERAERVWMVIRTNWENAVEQNYSEQSQLNSKSCSKFIWMEFEGKIISFAWFQPCLPLLPLQEKLTMLMKYLMPSMNPKNKNLPSLIALSTQKLFSNFMLSFTQLTLLKPLLPPLPLKSFLTLFPTLHQSINLRFFPKLLPKTHQALNYCWCCYCCCSAQVVVELCWGSVRCWAFVMAWRATEADQLKKEIC